MVQQRRATVATPPLRHVQGVGSPYQEGVEVHREGVRVETPKSPLGQALWMRE